jgi:hypothetical protein
MPNYALLSQGSTKINKSNTIQDEYFSRILYLAPDTLADGKRTVCPYAKIAKCNEACLNSAGMGVFSNVQQARIKKTLMFLNETEKFFDLLIKDIDKFVKECEKLGKKPALRLNGTSDIQWETIYVEDFKTIFEMYPNIQFYDYTKIPTRKVSHITNYHLTWSYSQANDKYASLFEKVPYNKAVVFFDALPSMFKGLRVIDGDKHDMRFLDKTNSVVGLLAKGKAKQDDTGFVIKALQVA